MSGRGSSSSSSSGRRAAPRPSDQAGAAVARLGRLAAARGREVSARLAAAKVRAEYDTCVLRSLIGTSESDLTRKPKEHGLRTQNVESVTRGRSVNQKSGSMYPVAYLVFQPALPSAVQFSCVGGHPQ